MQRRRRSIRRSCSRGTKSVIGIALKGLQSLIGGLNNAISDMAVKSNALTVDRRRAAEFEIETALRNAARARLPTMESLSPVQLAP